MTHTSGYGRVFWLGVAVGTVLMGYGVVLLVHGPVQDWPTANARLVTPGFARRDAVNQFVVIMMLHDVVLLPLVFGFAAAVLPRIPPLWRAPLRFALIVSAAVLLVAAWGLAGQAIRVQPGNPYILPNHYPTSVAVLLTPVWLAAVGWGVVTQLKHRASTGRSTSGVGPVAPTPTG